MYAETNLNSDQKRLPGLLWKSYRQSRISKMLLAAKVVAVINVLLCVIGEFFCRYIIVGV